MAWNGSSLSWERRTVSAARASWAGRAPFASSGPSAYRSALTVFGRSGVVSSIEPLAEKGGRSTMKSRGWAAATDRYDVEVTGGSKSIEIVARPGCPPRVPALGSGPPEPAVADRPPWPTAVIRAGAAPARSALTRGASFSNTFFFFFFCSAQFLLLVLFASTSPTPGAHLRQAVPASRPGDARLRTLWSRPCPSVRRCSSCAWSISRWRWLSRADLRNGGGQADRPVGLGIQNGVLGDAESRAARRPRPWVPGGGNVGYLGTWDRR